MLRRAVLFGRRLGRHEPFLAELAGAVVGQMGYVYPELRKDEAAIEGIIKEEEFRFEQTLDTGLNWMAKLMCDPQHKRNRRISAQEAFKLYDTYGFPKEMIAEVASERGFSVDYAGFEEQLEEQRERARAAQKTSGDQLRGFWSSRITYNLPNTNFVGFDSLGEIDCTIIELVDANGNSLDHASQGQEVGLYLDRTPFYAEMGGQVADTGQVWSANGKVQVSNVVSFEMAHKTQHDLAFCHIGQVIEGAISKREKAKAAVDGTRRLDIARNHTATHLLQSALRTTLGERVQQAGSLVEPDRLRFDFTHGSALTKQQLVQVQQIVNARIRGNLPVEGKTMSYTEAVAQGAIALFGEKYGDQVRVLEIGNPVVSCELCGGTHVKYTGEIGLFHITVETSIGSGVRRIEAVTGRAADKYIAQRLATLEAASQQFQTVPLQVPEKITALQAELDREHKRVLFLEQELAKETGTSLLSEVESVDGTNLLIAKAPSMSPESLRTLGDQLKSELKSGIFVLGTVFNDGPYFVAMVTPDLVAKKFHAGDIVKEVARIAGGGGGGRPELGQGSGKDKSKLDEALRQAKQLVQSH